MSESYHEKARRLLKEAIQEYRDSKKDMETPETPFNLMARAGQFDLIMAKVIEAEKNFSP